MPTNSYPKVPQTKLWNFIIDDVLRDNELLVRTLSVIDIPDEEMSRAKKVNWLELFLIYLVLRY